MSAMDDLYAEVAPTRLPTKVRLLKAVQSMRECRARGTVVLGAGLMESLDAAGLAVVPLGTRLEGASLEKALAVLPAERIGTLYAEGLTVLTTTGMTADRLMGVVAKGGGPFIGPRGGKWADARHTIPWKEDGGAHPSGKQEAAGSPKVSAAVKQVLQAAIDSGAVKGTVEEHIAIAQRETAKHTSKVEGELAMVARLLGKDAKLDARAKALESALGKIVRKPKLYPDASKMDDLTGIRSTHETLAGVEAAVAKLRGKYKVVRESDYIADPLGYYRSHHLIVEADDGRRMEIQVRTKRMDQIANWAHDIYKPLTPEQEKAVVDHRDEIMSYADAIATHYADLDRGKASKAPEAPASVRSTFGTPEGTD